MTPVPVWQPTPKPPPRYRVRIARYSDYFAATAGDLSWLPATCIDLPTRAAAEELATVFLRHPEICVAVRIDEVIPKEPR
jgi:hypothetical protein